MNGNVAEPIEGGCLCGAVRYRAMAVPRARSLCHCRSCRRASGAPSVAWTIFPVDAFAFTGDPPVRFRSSPFVWRTFCGRCGTSLTYQRHDRPGHIDVATASLDRPDDFPPAVEIWVSHKLAWERSNDMIPQYSESSRKT